MSHSPSQCTLEIPLPPRIDQQFRRWVERTPGATWPRWGGHVTILNRFGPERGIEPVIQEIEPVCAAFRPFAIQLDRLICDPHWLEPRMECVILVSRHDQEGYRTLIELHDTVCARLDTLTRGVQLEICKRAYVPHLSLTSGLSESEAPRLAQAAHASHLKVEFAVQSISLLEFAEGASGKEEMRRARSFALASRLA